MSEFPNDANDAPYAALRDYFAAAALTGICSHNDTWGIANLSSIAQEAYSLADAMIEARNK